MNIIKEWKTKEGYKARVVSCEYQKGITHHYCGYIGITKKHPLFEKSYSQHCDALMKLRDKVLKEPIGKRGIIPIFCYDGESASMHIIFNVHGGITFADYHDKNKSLWWIGFDCAHEDDTIEKCNVEYVIAECNSLSKQINVVE